MRAVEQRQAAAAMVQEMFLEREVPCATTRRSSDISPRRPGFVPRSRDNSSQGELFPTHNG